MYDPLSIRILMGNIRGNFLLHDCIMGAHTPTTAARLESVGAT